MTEGNNNDNKNWSISTTRNNNNSNYYVRLKIGLSVIALSVIFVLYSLVTNERYTFDTYNNNNDHKKIIYQDNNDKTNNDEDESTSTTTTITRYLDRNKTNDTNVVITNTVVPENVTQQTTILTSAPTNSPSTAPPSNAPTHTASYAKNVMTPNTNNINNNENNTLENLHLVFIGDAITKYQYLDLIYYLHTGRWMDNYERPNILREKDFKSWTNYYGYSNRIFDGKEKCDCYRNKRFTPETTFEQRYYSDPYHNNYITYIQKFGHILAHGHWNPEDAYQNITSIQYNYRYDSNSTNNDTVDSESSSFLWKRYHELAHPMDPTWKYDWIDLIQHHVALLQPRPQYLIMNAGLWPHDLHNRTYLEQIQQVCQLNNITTIYKTTTSQQNEGNSNYFVNNTYEIIACHIFDICFNMSWTQNIPRTNDYYWDEKHFQPITNRFFNEQLFLLLNHNDYPSDTINEWISDDDRNKAIDTNNNNNNAPENLHLVFIGDSITRYQYLDLVYYLHTGGWSKNHQWPNILREKDFKSWSEFFTYSNRMFDGKEKCDCYHDRRSKGLHLEQRYYSDPDRNNYITFILKYGYRLAQGHWHPHDAYQNTTSIHYNYHYDNNSTNNDTIDSESSALLWTRYHKLAHLIKPAWEYDWIDLIQYHVALLQPRPQYLIVNAGIWPHDLLNQTYLEKIQRVCHLNNMTTIYKTTTSSREEGNSNYFVNHTHEIIACSIFDLCLNMSWTQNVLRTIDFFWDPFHFQPHMNRYFNEQLFLLLNHNDYHNYTINEWIGDVVV